ncbi:DUF934 domain-containing protein [Pseudomaricurvus alkylphenolicus]|jgi:uncharacterized protein (DUF934 family)|uniref:DUF934 domain-containing protein n=1 Tax=Pseudomaricurvus alkylphenolicus TaxID=1306991 RepID=UPI0014228111|nr:DUF934 domain-containing protein [Pseudomaricurvus alkylphenolicus]NIB41159.1 DUF934 domain-containing protein [Pseudomaricurvus alkylphenolicus]
MPKLIKDSAIAEDNWQLLAASDDASTEVPAGQVIVPLNVWHAQKETLSQRADEIGVWLDSDQLADEIGDDASKLPLIAVNFPGFMDGRGFSTARLLRERHGFTGELRAIGGVIRDQLCYLKRCGFNSFDLDDSIDLAAAIESLNDFTEGYQASVDQPLPLFRRRA